MDDAFSHDYRVIIPEECMTGRAELPHRVNLFDMEMSSGDVMSLEKALQRLASLDQRPYGKVACLR